MKINVAGRTDDVIIFMVKVTGPMVGQASLYKVLSVLCSIAVYWESSEVFLFVRKGADNNV